MNYGRYFKLNQVVSKVVDGVTVYDYIDLPAFFGPSVDTPQTPKYPISVTITSDAVLFRVHYSCFKAENEKESVPEYSMHLDEVLALDNPGWSLSTVHLEEIIMELPFVDTYRLADNIREVYSTLFPMPVGDKDNNNYGGRFFFKLLEKRYRGEDGNKESVEWKMYENLRNNAKNRLSYSQLAEMGVEEESIYEKGEDVKIFLRKLLLDFMFDLRHSDIFQLNPHYRQMLSGLMSDYYFTSLMHKCEYYYQRKLVNLYYGIDEERVNKKKRKKTRRIHKLRRRKQKLINLYCRDFFLAEDHWMHDILNPQSERAFDTGSWFKPPEEEMSRLYLEKESRSRNVDKLIGDLGLRKREHGEEVGKMVAGHDRNREASSRWFLQRYDFADVLCLHFFPDAPNMFFSIVFVICVLFSIPSVPILIPVGIGVALFLTLLVTACIRMIRRRDGGRHFIACLHMFMPRMVAAIATAWLTLALCYELIIANFDQENPAWFLMAVITLGLSVFVLYKINLCVPRVRTKKKLLRTLEFFILSYYISTIIGFVVIACVGGPFMEEAIRGAGDAAAQEAFIKVVEDASEYLLESEKFFFVLRKLTVTFSFVAMFIGIFIQLIIGEEKQMTEL